MHVFLCFTLFIVQMNEHNAMFDNNIFCAYKRVMVKIL